MVGPLTFTFTASAQSFNLPAPEGPVEYFIQVIGAGVLTIEFQDSGDLGTTYVALQLINATTGAGAANITAAGIFRFGGGGQAGTIARMPRLQSVAFTSGNLVVKVFSVLRP